MTASDILTTPLGFTLKKLGLPQYDWQAQAMMMLEDVSGRRKTAVSAPNGAGKSKRVVAPSALYVLAMFPQGKVRITTADAKQLDDQIIPGIEEHIRKFEGWKSVRSPYYKVTTPSGGTLVAFTTDDEGRVEGSHQELPHAPLLSVIDEAKTVKDQIHQGTDRCSYTWLLETSSPGLAGQGRFWKNCTELRGDGKNGTFKVIQAGFKDCPHKDKKIIEDIIKTYGENHPFTRSSVYGEFMEQDEANRYIVSLSSLERCITNPPPFRPGIRVAFCDFAAGGDENVIALREGNRISLEAHWREKDLRAAVYRFIQEFRRLNLKAEEIWGDASGKDIMDMLAASGWELNRKNFGDRNCQEIYKSWGAQAWMELALSIEKCEVILPNDDTFKAQATSRMKKPSDSGKLGIEEKWFMFKRNLPSPDRFDAAAGAWSLFPATQVATKEFRIPPGYFTNPEYRDNEENAGLLAEIGADAGL